ncbi:copper homeostasis periplasmic binding protein CopC [Pseudomonas aeruginosa]|uniref:copper homeostasis periplasmic binding protein CopC n=1 Tax=Pseudomonas aeruginosa TaxID=287 RepID=UPI000D696195|nr:copper homeostasis periplasmic binding protein CopC [Pseudomonas aeruginosa]MBI7310053.1 copper homeostasis periplasmic binding protein CopC [Pseudomonas aeruginosa]
MHSFTFRWSLALLTAGMLVSGLAQAHPKLLSSTPENNAVGAAPKAIELRFSEDLLPRFSGAKLIMTDMPGMPNSPMEVKTSASAGADPRTLLVTPAAALGKGRYRVEWRAVSSDTHPVTGTLGFEVR